MGVIPLYSTKMQKKVAEEHYAPRQRRFIRRQYLTLQEASCPSDAGGGHPRTQSRARC